MQDILCYFNVFRLLSNLRLLESLFISSFRGRTFAINIPEVTGSQQCKLFHVGSEDFVHFPLLLILQTHVLQTFQSEIQQNQPVASFFFFFLGKCCQQPCRCLELCDIFRAASSSQVQCESRPNQKELRWHFLPTNHSSIRQEKTLMFILSAFVLSGFWLNLNLPNCKNLDIMKEGVL